MGLFRLAIRLHTIKARNSYDNNNNPINNSGFYCLHHSQTIDMNNAQMYKVEHIYQCVHTEQNNETPTKAVCYGIDSAVDNSQSDVCATYLLWFISAHKHGDKWRCDKLLQIYHSLEQKRGSFILQRRFSLVSNY